MKVTEKDGTREKIIACAAELFWQQGYLATGISQILESAGVLRGSLYYYFPTKEDLLIATLEWRLRQLKPDVVQPVLDRLDDPVERVFGVLNGYRDLLLMAEFRLGCPIGNLALELDESHPRVRRLLSQNFDNWCAEIEECLRPARGRLPADVDLGRLANYCLTVMEGAVMLARTHRSIEPYDAAITMLRDYFERLLAAGGTWSAAAT